MPSQPAGAAAHGSKYGKPSESHFSDCAFVACSSSSMYNTPKDTSGIGSECRTGHQAVMLQYTEPAIMYDASDRSKDSQMCGIAAAAILAECPHPKLVERKGPHMLSLEPQSPPDPCTSGLTSEAVLKL